MTSKQVNIFDFATSELSHDAILCYILSLCDSGIDVEEKISKELYYLMLKENLKKDFDLEKFISKKFTFKTRDQISDTSVNNLNHTGITKQKKITYNNGDKEKAGYIDISVDLSIDEDRYLFIIEDKVEANEHGSQLRNYQEHIMNDKNYSESYKINFAFITHGLKPLVYLRNIEANSDSLWKVISSNDINNIFKKYEKSISNDILVSYKLYLRKNIEKTQSYKKKCIGNWGYHACQGFFSEFEVYYLEKFDIEAIIGWGYVPNPNGGFMGCWFHFSESFKHSETLSYRVYLQLELSNQDNRIALKIEFNDLVNDDKKVDVDRVKIRDQYIEVVELRGKVRSESDESNNNHINVFKKTRRSMGNHVTIAEIILKNELEHEGVMQEIIDAINEVEVIKKMGFIQSK